MNNFCEQCGAQLSEGVRFCEACGVSVAPLIDRHVIGSSMPLLKSSHNFCEQCGIRLPEEARFCEECGHRVDPSFQETEISEPPPITARTAGPRLAKKFLILGSTFLILITAAVIGVKWWQESNTHTKEAVVAKEFKDPQATIQNSNSLSSKLNERLINKLFAPRSNEDGRSFVLRDIKILEGSFSTAGAQEAIVGFYDDNSSHASGWSQVWWLAYDGDWKIIMKLFQADRAIIKNVDLGDRGLHKIWIQGGGGTQGYFNIRGNLYSLTGRRVTTLFETKGYDNTGAYGDYERFEISFRDVNKDGLMELIETRTKGKADTKTGKETLVSKDEHIYQLVGQKYVKIPKEHSMLPGGKTPGVVFSLTAIIDDPDGYTNVRREKSTSSDIIARVTESEQFFTYYQDGNWWQIKTRDGKIGYMHGSRIKIVSGK